MYRKISLLVAAFVFVTSFGSLAEFGFAAPAKHNKPQPARADVVEKPAQRSSESTAAAGLGNMTEDEKGSYALGVLLGLDAGKEIGSKNFFKKEAFLKGIKDGVDNNPKMNQEQINSSYGIFQAKLQVAALEAAEKNAAAGAAYIEKFSKESGVKKTSSGLAYLIQKAGKGVLPTNEDNVTVKYKGSLIDGTVFDESIEPVSFPLSGVIPGFSEGLKLIGEGGKIKLVIPPALGYGDANVGVIPSKSTLVFEVELIKIEKISDPNKAAN